MEALVDTLRGKVKVNIFPSTKTVLWGKPTLLQVQTHCYEAVDFDAFVRVCLLSGTLCYGGILTFFTAV